MTYDTIEVMKISKASKVRTMTITFVSSVETSFTFLRDVAGKKFTINCN